MERTFSSAGFVLLTYVVKMERRYLQRIMEKMYLGEIL